MTNVDVLRLVGNPVPLNATVLRRKMRYFGHAMRSKGAHLERDLMD